jgi:hypothetical protein
MNASKKLSVGVIVACVALLGGAIFGGVADAKKKSSNTATLTHGATPLTPATGAGPTLRYGVTDIPFTVSKKFKGKIVKADSVTFTYAVAALAGGLQDYTLRLLNPKGRAVTLSSPGNAASTTVGPLTQTPDSPFDLCSTPPCPDPFHTVVGPAFVGTIGDSSLAHYTGTAMRGTWIAEFEQQDPVTSVTKPATVTSSTLKIGGESKPLTK